jgi:hypothetical protein
MIWCDLDNTRIRTWEPLITAPIFGRIYGVRMDENPHSPKDDSATVAPRFLRASLGTVCGQGHMKKPRLFGTGAETSEEISANKAMNS